MRVYRAYTVIAVSFVYKKSQVYLKIATMILYNVYIVILKTTIINGIICIQNNKGKPCIHSKPQLHKKGGRSYG